jgi:hypothetical protein
VALLTGSVLRADEAEDRAEKAVRALHGYTDRDETAIGRPVVSVAFPYGIPLTDSDLKVLSELNTTALSSTPLAPFQGGELDA